MSEPIAALEDYNSRVQEVLDALVERYQHSSGFRNMSGQRLCKSLQDCGVHPVYPITKAKHER